MKRKQPFWVRLFSPVKLKTQRIDKAGSHPRVRLAAFNVFVGIGSFLVAFLLGSVLMIPGESSAEDISTLSNDASLSVALTPEAMNLAVTPTPGGTLASDEMAIQVSTDNTTGYTLALSLAGAETSLNDPASGGKIQSSIADINSPATLSVNTWGWYPDSLANNTGNLFSALPSNSDPYELKKTSSATSGSGETTTISFGVNVDTTLPAGSYTNAIVISAVTNYVPQPILDVYPTTGWAGDTITLYSNGGFVNVQSVQIGGTDCTSIDVKSADELTCTLPDKAETDTTSGTDNGYSISVTASNTSLDTHNFTIRYFNPSTTTSMQEFTGTTCGSMSVGDIASLTDERNNQTYRIKKMQDNKCWMVDNLKYAGEANTDLANVDGTYGLVYNNESGKYNTVDGTSTQSTENSDKAFYNNPMSGSYCYGTSIQSSYTKCGYLYNWYAATAGTGTYATSTNGTNVSGSICPTGWRLPSATSDGSTATGDGTSYTAADFPVLNASMNAGSLTTGSTSNYPTGWQFTGAWSGVFSGNWYNGFYYQGSNGFYRSSTAYSSTLARNLHFGSSGVDPGDGSDNKYYGYAIRCVMDEVPVTKITYDSNGGFFNGDSSQLSNIVLYDTDEVGTQYIRDEGNNYDETFTMSGAVSLVVDFYCFSGGGSNYRSVVELLDGSGKLVEECSAQPIYVPDEPGRYYNPTSKSGTYIISGDSIRIIMDGSGPAIPEFNATITGYHFPAVSGTEELTPTRSGYIFAGWYTDPAGTDGNEFVPNRNMESGTTVYAKWIEDLTIVFDGNGNTGGSMSNQVITYGNNTLNTNAYTRSNYAFTGWNTKADGSGTTYKDGATYRYTSSIGSDVLTLYAQWTPFIQNFALAQCQSQASSGNVTVVDQRDNNYYTVRYINGNCWMTQNLRLSGGRTLTPADSNVASNWSFPSNSLTSGDSYTEARSLISSNTSYGGYYNFCAASAGTVCSTDKQNSTYDICPKGWRLPTSSEQNSIISYLSAFSPIAAGNYSGGMLADRGYRSHWWSSTVYSSVYQYALDYDSNLNFEVTNTYGFRDRGLSVRCIRSN